MKNFLRQSVDPPVGGTATELRCPLWLHLSDFCSRNNLLLLVVVFYLVKLRASPPSSTHLPAENCAGSRSFKCGDRLPIGMRSHTLSRSVIREQQLSSAFARTSVARPHSECADHDALGMVIPTAVLGVLPFQRHNPT
jgi:hypothetical protein